MEFEPLFDAGFHNIIIEDLEELFASPFPNSKNRKNFVIRLKYYLKKLQEIGINLEIWIDGSFATQKKDPADIDIAVFADPQLVNNLSNEKKEQLSRLVANKIEIKLRYKCHIYFCPDNDQKIKSQWRGWFGFDQDENPKGIPRLILTVNNE